MPHLGATPATGYGFFLMPGTAPASPIYSGQVILGP